MLAHLAEEFSRLILIKTGEVDERSPRASKVIKKVGNGYIPNAKI